MSSGLYAEAAKKLLCFCETIEPEINPFYKDGRGQRGDNSKKTAVNNLISQIRAGDAADKLFVEMNSKQLEAALERILVDVPKLLTVQKDTELDYWQLLRVCSVSTSRAKSAKDAH